MPAISSQADNPSLQQKKWPYYEREQVYGRSQCELILGVQAAIGTDFQKPCKKRTEFRDVFSSYGEEDTDVCNLGQACTHPLLIVNSDLRIYESSHAARY